MKHLISTLICGAVVAILCAGCAELGNLAGLQKPTASIKGVSFNDVSLDAASLLFDVEVKNPYSVALPLTDLEYALSTGEQGLFSGKAAAAGLIDAKGSKVVPIEAKISYLDLVKAFKDVRPGSKIPYQADAKLMVDAPALGVIPIPLKKKGELDVPSIPKASDIDWDKVIDAVRK